MPRNMSFSLTTEQVRNRTKTVTRRLGWKFAKPGDIYWAVEKAMGLKKGEKIVRITLIRVVSTRWEPIGFMSDADCIREGFPDWDKNEFIDMFCKHNQCERDREVNRIEFQYPCRRNSSQWCVGWMGGCG